MAVVPVCTSAKNCFVRAAVNFKLPLADKQ